MKDSAGIFLLLILLAAVIAYELLKTKIKGLIGEKAVAATLSMLDSSKYKVINNVVLSGHGKTAQIDHLVISNYGIFVIETKNYKGWIVGGENSEYWTQIIYKWRKKFYNPIRQNAGHVQALRNNLQEFPNLQFISIIIFSNRATIKVRTNTAVIHPRQLLKFIGNYSEGNLSDGIKEGVFEKINSINLKGNYNKSQHIALIQQTVKKREESVQQKKCPQCGASIVLRKGKYGSFLGCSAFPKCKFTSNI
jgi:transposase-like protein